MIIRGGEETCTRGKSRSSLYGHPGGSRTWQVIGVPDLRYGEEICAWVKLRPGEALTEAELREYCQGQIRALLRSRAICGLPAIFPMTVTGKVQKFKMREASIHRAGPGGTRPARPPPEAQARDS